VCGILPAMARADRKSIAFLSDIHGNIDALDAVYEDMAGFSVGGIVCLGDIIGYGPEPARCVQRVMDTCDACVLGNHEVMFFLTEQLLAESCDMAIGRPIEIARKRLRAAQRRWLEALPLTGAFGEVEFCHASLNDPAEFNYIDSEEEARAHFTVQKAVISFHGHTHLPAIWQSKRHGCDCYHPGNGPVQLEKGRRYAVNCGSVGQPRDGDPRACYLLYDPAARVLLHRRVPYDLKRAVARFKKSGLPEENFLRLLEGA
jgi:diadenosine tetraphosphatase ApaH/serine/threonine PP2A family protein phosphatase